MVLDPNITRNLEEVLTDDELSAALASGRKLKHYIGFEISGKIHLGTGIISMGKIKDFMDAGIETTVFLADWHTFINKKLGGADMKTIGEVGVGYFKEGMKAAFVCVGGDPGKLNFVLGSELYSQTSDYWQTVIRVAKETTLARAKRSVDIMGRSANEEMPTANLFYPMMQAADIFALNADIAHAGTDQRKVHVVARDVASALGMAKPIAAHHHLAMGLGKPPIWPIPEDQKREMMTQMKMSKSKPDSAVFIHDTPDDVRAKIKKAFAPPKEIEYNPIFDWVRHIIFMGGADSTSAPQEISIKRSPTHGGDLTVSLDELTRLYAAGDLHPEDLKSAVAERLIDLLEPARSHFASGDPKDMLSELEAILNA